MRIVNPSCELLAVTRLIANPELSPECLIEQAGRTCYKSDVVKCAACNGTGEIEDRSFGTYGDCLTCKGKGYVERDYAADPNPESAAKFVGRIVKRGHESVIEHASATVRFITDRGVTHELVRHRLASYSQESTRYVDYERDKHGNEIAVIEPPFSGKTAPLQKAQGLVWASAMREAEQKYLSLRQADAPPQIARSVLPNSLKTEIVTTFNIREWCHFFRLRLAKAAHPQIRQIAYLAFTLLQIHFPTILAPLESLAKAVVEDLEALTGKGAVLRFPPPSNPYRPRCEWVFVDPAPAAPSKR